MTSMFRRLIAVVALVVGLGAAVGAPSASAQSAPAQSASSHSSTQPTVAPSDWWWGY